MSDIEATLQGAVDAIMEELDLLWADLTAVPDSQKGDAVQRRTRAAYEAAAAAPPDQAAAAQQQFEQQHGGPDEWVRQQGLHLTRQSNAQQGQAV